MLIWHVLCMFTDAIQQISVQNKKKTLTSLVSWCVHLLKTFCCKLCWPQVCGSLGQKKLELDFGSQRAVDMWWGITHKWRLLLVRIVDRENARHIVIFCDIIWFVISYHWYILWNYITDKSWSGGTKASSQTRSVLIPERGNLDINISQSHKTQ